MGNNDTIELVYSIYSTKKPQEQFLEINKNPEDLKLSKLDEIFLKAKPLKVKLSIGVFKLDSDFAEVMGNDYGGRYIKYKRVK